MAHLSIVGSHKVNGVSALHSELLVETIFADFAALWPGALHQHDQRRHAAALAGAGQPGRWPALLDRRIGPRLAAATSTSCAQLRAARGDAGFRDAFAAVKRANKVRLAELHRSATTGIVVDPDSLFDVQVKRIHEYKRQLLNVLHVVTRYQADPGRPGRRLGAAHGDLRRQGGVGLRTWPSSSSG